MLRKIFLLVLIVFLFACSSMNNVPLVSTATSIPTLEQQVTPTLLPIPTPEPSPTLDPNMPPDATGKDTQGYWIKTVRENGKTLAYTWLSEKDANNNPEFEGWVRPLTDQGGIPTLDLGPTGEGWPNEVFVASDVPGAGNLLLIRHTAGTKGEYSSKDSGETITTVSMGFINPILGSDFSIDQALVGNGNGVKVTYIASDGKSYTTTIGPTTGIETIIVNNLSANDPNVGEFQAYGHTFWAKTMPPDQNGKIVQFIQVVKGDISDPKVEYVATFYGLSIIFSGTSPKEGGGFSPQLQVLVDDAQKGTPAYVQLVAAP